MSGAYAEPKSTNARWMIYGATGYTGKLIAEAACTTNLTPVLAGRDVARLAQVAGPLGLEYRTASLNHHHELDTALHDISVVVNAAGPYSATARPLVDACLRSGTHYIDVTGEIPIFETLHQRDGEARNAEIMLMPGAGFAVLASDCLAHNLLGRLPDATHLRIGISRSNLVSRGSAKTLIELFDNGVKIRRNSALVSIPIGSLERNFDFGTGARTALAVSWPDVFTAGYSTGIANIETYFEAGPVEKSMAVSARYSGWMMNLPLTRPWLNMQLAMLPEGPSASQRASGTRVVVAEAENQRGEIARSRLHTPEAYSFTALSVLMTISDILAGNARPGFQTPASLFSVDTVATLPGVTLEHLGN